jgi:transposase InsO family protein
MILLLPLSEVVYLKGFPTLRIQGKFIYQANRQVYGSPRMHAALRAEGQSCGKKRVAQPMRELGLNARPHKHRTRTTDSQHEQPVAPNLLNREFTATAPNTKSVADITAIWTSEGWLYLAVVLDIFSRMVVGWAMGAHRDEALVEQAARMALACRQPEPGLVHHSDRGSQVTATDYRELLAQYGIVVSMSGKGDCYDNALMGELLRHAQKRVRRSAVLCQPGPGAPSDL